MLDPYCPVLSQVVVPDNVNLVPPRGGAAGSMPRNTPEVRCPPLQAAQLPTLLLVLPAQHAAGQAPGMGGRPAHAAACTPLLLS